MTNRRRRPQATRHRTKTPKEPILPKLWAAFRRIYVDQIIKAYRINPHRFWTIFVVALITATLINWPTSETVEVDSEDSMRVININPSGDASTTEPEAVDAEQSDISNEVIEPVLAPAPPPRDPWKRYTVESGDNLSKMFYRAGLTDRDVYLFTNQGGDINDFTNLNIGNEIWFDIQDGQLVQAKLVYDQLNYLIASPSATDIDAYDVELVTLTPDVVYESAEAVITDSLFMSATRVGISERLTMELANIFGWDIDFALDIRENDTFKVVYEKLYLDGEYIGDGDIVAASFGNRGRHLEAVRYTNRSGDTAYHAPDGRSMRKAFLRTPVDFARISSHFNLSRRHPVLHTVRAHKGTDYAAPRGTPIRAAGDGRVEFAGVRGGWGNVVIIQHGEQYKTLYAHQQRFARGIRAGARVSQGQVIGYVGSSGLATGPHLHYEFYVNGAVRNPVTVELPEAEPISDGEFAHFEAQTAGLLAMLNDGGVLQSNSELGGQ